MSDATRQHHRLATGEDISGQAKGEKTHERYAKGGHVSHGSHGHKGMHESGHGHHGHTHEKKGKC